MKVSLIDYTGAGSADPWYAALLLIFTKNTRLNMTADNFEEMSRKYSEAEILQELAYIADTIPSSWEFVDYTFAVEGVTRAYTHQQVRTRTASYAQQSMRVTNMEDFSYRLPPNLNEEAQLHFHSAMEEINYQYGELIKAGAAEEDARGVLPTNILTNIICKFNLRVLSDIVKSREGGRTQDEYREVVSEMGSCVLQVHPWAEPFLYPRGRDYWKELEDAIKTLIPNMKIRAPVLKIIDKMRKQ